MKYYKITKDGKNLLKDIFNIDKNNIDGWIRSYHKGKLKDRIKKYMYID